MLMRLKNKITLGFSKLITSTEKEKGVPDFIEISPKEAYELLRELNNCKDVRDSYTFTQKNDQHDIRLQLFGDVTTDQLNDIANNWYKGNIGILFKELPIKIVVPPTKPKPRNETFKRKMTQKR